MTNTLKGMDAAQVKEPAQAGEMVDWLLRLFRAGVPGFGEPAFR